MECPIDAVAVRFLQHCIEHGSSTVINKDWFFREQVRFVANSMGIHYSLMCAASRITDAMEVKICISSDWCWRIPDFERLTRAQSSRVAAKRKETVRYLSDLATLHGHFAEIEAELKIRPRLFSCLPWAWRGCCGDCQKVKRLVEALPKSMYEKCFQRLVSGGLVGRDFGIGIYIVRD